VEEAIRPALRDRSVRFVFPSEICAESWLARSLGMGVGAIEAGRFLGWDRLKEEAAGDDGGTASDDYLRAIFAASLLAENAARPFLTAMLPPAFADDWQPFAGYLASRLPALGRLPEAVRGGTHDDPSVADWLSVRLRYEAFLQSTGRFEPSYERRVFRALAGRTVIFFPELIEDFEEYRAVLEAAPSVTLVALPGLPDGVRMSRPATALAELRLVLSEVGELLDSGVEAERIAITVASLDRYRPYLEREATLLSLPLAVRSGQSLAASPGGRLFAALRDLCSSDFSYDALRDLALSPAWPWKDVQVFRAIMAEGLRLHAVAPWPEGPKMVDAWERSLSGSLLAAYRRLKSRAKVVVAAPDFRSLLKAYNAFRAEFLSPKREDWDRGADLSLARCVVELQNLVRAQDQAALGISGAFGVFMRLLDSTPYVSAVSGGVPVYAWRVAAGTFPDRHFVLNASQDALALPSRGFDYLGPALRKALAPAGRDGTDDESGDAAPAFIAAYALSGADVSFSCPETGFDGDVAAHGFLVSVSKEEDAEGQPGKPRDGSYREEAAWLSGRGPAPARLHRTQALGLAAAAAAPPTAPAAKTGGAWLCAETAALVGARLRREGDPRTGIDETSIDRYRSCPYAYLYLRLLRAGPEPSGISFVDDIFIGEVYHEALAHLFELIRDADGPFRSERADAYRDLVGGCLDHAFAKLAKRRGDFVGIVLETCRADLDRHIRNLVAAEAERFPSLEIGPIEEEFELEYPEVAGGVVLRGRVDRISRSDRGAVVVDYKKGMVPTRAQVAPDAAGDIARAQIPCYLRLVRGADRAGEKIDSAWYISIEGHGERKPGAAVCAYDATAPAPADGPPGRGAKGPYVTGLALAPFLEAFDAALRATAEGILAGAFPLAPKDTQDDACQDCGARGICRERYALRFGAQR
jgi:RecB family exonuclease